MTTREISVKYQITYGVALRVDKAMKGICKTLNIRQSSVAGNRRKTKRKLSFPKKGKQ